MIAWDDTQWRFARPAAFADATTLALSDETAGLVAGTQVATAHGWCRVVDIAPGDDVLTLDNGMVPVSGVARRSIMTAGPRPPARLWPLLAPPGALNNREALLLTSDQPVMLESDTAEAALGEPFCTVPAAALDGFRGIARVMPPARIDIVMLRFARPQVIFGNHGALLACREGAAGLTLAQGRRLVRYLELEDAGERFTVRAADVLGASAA
ncbi:MAG: hypothetical protein GC146_00785 [Limimaricola sp.]|uniref:Hint domain-containing protein n=1 Tax=Limimaricola sp. TaxID=2211665 RepID=UPI001D2CDB85|nr:Hint domain-containing protein [Limimaricola sp.]MBI1415732.1 hypothetical protein [Limimaricola sp.]